jgi:hypothetical protein
LAQHAQQSDALADKLMLRERFVIETVVDILKCEMELEHSRHRSVMNAMVHILSCLVAYASGQQAIHLDVVPKDRGSSIAWVRYEPQARRRVLTALCSRGKAVPESSMVDSRSCPSLAISIREKSRLRAPGMAKVVPPASPSGTQARSAGDLLLHPKAWCVQAL